MEIKHNSKKPVKRRRTKFDREKVLNKLYENNSIYQKSQLTVKKPGPKPKVQPSQETKKSKTVTLKYTAEGITRMKSIDAAYEKLRNSRKANRFTASYFRKSRRRIIPYDSGSKDSLNLNPACNSNTNLSEFAAALNLKPSTILDLAEDFKSILNPSPSPPHMSENTETRDIAAIDY